MIAGEMSAAVPEGGLCMLCMTMAADRRLLFPQYVAPRILGIDYGSTAVWTAESLLRPTTGDWVDELVGNAGALA